MQILIGIGRLLAGLFLLLFFCHRLFFQQLLLFVEDITAALGLHSIHGDHTVIRNAQHIALLHIVRQFRTLNAVKMQIFFFLLVFAVGKLFSNGKVPLKTINDQCSHV